jgi:Na+-translocating ferredoxin:NAD+ oxidoreductase RnfG subunit
MLKPSLPLAIITAACASLLALTNMATNSRIESNRQDHERQMIGDLTGSDPTTQSSWSNDVWDLCNNVVLVRSHGTGYGGPIALLVALTTEHPEGNELRLLGLRVTKHQETPGLADFLAQPNSGWLSHLAGLTGPEVSAVDTVAGATITSIAIRRTVLRAFSRFPDPMAIPGACPQ